VDVQVLEDYDLIVIGTGSGLELAQAFLEENQEAKVAIIDKDEPGGICLTRGCIPSKLLIYPADLVRIIQSAGDFGIEAEVKKVDSASVLRRMRTLTDKEIEAIGSSLRRSERISYYQEPAEFVEPYTLRVGNDTIKSKIIFLSLGSRPAIPGIQGLEEVGYLTSDTILNLKELPKSLGIVGGGYIAAEFGHFLSAMGCEVTIIGRNPQFIPEEEPEVSALAKREMSKNATILTSHEVRSVELTSEGKKRLTAVNAENQKETIVVVDEILVATGRRSNADILHPEKSGIQVDKKGFIVVNEFLETTKPNIWAMGDANGKFMFKHVANYESQIVFFNAILKRKVKVDYHAVPHAVFTDPEIASVGMGEKEAVEKYGRDDVLVGFQRYFETARGEAMNLKDEFVKIIVEKKTRRILGAHIIGPQASTLIQEVINVMYTEKQNSEVILEAMHIHPALPEVVQRAFSSLMTVEVYNNHFLKEHLDFFRIDKV
jgi:mycothione reductase